MTPAKISWLGFIGIALFVLATFLGGLQFSNYSHISQLISESYAIDTPYGKQLRYLAFIPSGILIACFSFFIIKQLPPSSLIRLSFVGVALFYGIATVLVSLFPCDAGCDKELINPSISQLIHNITGLTTYLVVPVCVLAIGIAFLKYTATKYIALPVLVCGLIAIIFVGILSTDLHSTFSGLYQRIIEGAILLFIFISAFHVNKLKTNAGNG